MKTILILLTSSWFYVDYPCPAQIAVEFTGELVLEFDHAVYQGVQGRIAADADVAAGVVFGAFLADNDRAFFNGLVAEDFYA